MRWHADRNDEVWRRRLRPSAPSNIVHYVLVWSQRFDPVQCNGMSALESYRKSGVAFVGPCVNEVCSSLRAWSRIHTGSSQSSVFISLVHLLLQGELYKL